LGRKSQVGLAGVEERFSENIRIEQGVDVSHKPLPIDDVKKRREFLIGRSLDQRNSVMAKIVCVLYDDPVDGYPKSYARDDVPKIERYPGGQTLPTPKGIDFKPGALLGSVSGGLGLRKYLESNGHTFVVTSDKDGANSIFERELTDADVVISQPFWPAYLTAERIAKAKKLKLAITAGIGSDHVDLQAAIDRGITVAEVTYSNSISVSEHVVMMILGLVRNYIPSYQWVVKGGWNIADCAARSYDVEGMHVGTVAAGRIGVAVLRRLKPFDMHLHYYDRHRLPESVEKELGLAWHPNVEDMVKVCDVVTINAPLHPETENLFNDKLLSKMKRGAYLVNTARGKICDRDAIVQALKSGQLAGYAGDVWFPQPAPKDHPWRTMPHHGMTPHVSGTCLSAQARYAAGTREILECFFERRPIRDEYLIVDGGKLAGAGAHSYSAGDATSGSDEAAKFKGAR
jgi:formate dehydrogenase